MRNIFFITAFVVAFALNSCTSEDLQSNTEMNDNDLLQLIEGNNTTPPIPNNNLVDKDPDKTKGKDD